MEGDQLSSEQHDQSPELGAATDNPPASELDNKEEGEEGELPSLSRGETVATDGVSRWLEGEKTVSQDSKEGEMESSNHQSNSSGPTQDSSSSQPRPTAAGRPQYQLVFGMDDTSSEFEASLTSTTGSPRSLDVNNVVANYLSQNQYLPSPVVSQSNDVGLKSDDLKSLSHDLTSESHDHPNSVEDTDGQRKASTTSTGDDVSSVYSASTIRGGSVSGQSSAKLPTAVEKEEGRSGTPNSEIKLEDIKLRSRSPDSPRETPPPHPKVHALNILTSDSDAGDSPPYSPVPYNSGW